MSSAPTDMDFGPAFITGPLHGHGVPVIDPSDFPFMEAASRGEIEIPENDSMDNLRSTDEPLDYTELISKEAFIGEYPLETIIEGITGQFDNYIGTEDRTNYVDIFFNQLKRSYAAIDNDDGEEHPAELREALDKILDQFLSTIQRLFGQRLTITIMDLEGDEIDKDSVETSITLLYEFFILDAKKNFMTAISKDISSKIHTVIEDDRQYYKTVREMLMHYSPLIIEFGPMEFISYCGNHDVYELFNSGRVVGNFLRKYSPKLYQYEDFEVEIISHITMIQEVKEEILNGKQ